MGESEVGGRGVTRPAGAVAGLADAVAALRAELTQARAAGGDAELRFQLGDIQMEFAVEVTADAEAHGGVRFWVVDVGGKVGMASTGSHRVTLTLSPTTADGRRAEIRDVD